MQEIVFMVIHIRALLPEGHETRMTKHAGKKNLVGSSAPLANPNEAQASIKETGCCEKLRNRTLIQERDAVTKLTTAAATSMVRPAKGALRTSW